MVKHNCPYRDGLGKMIHEVSATLCNWRYAQKHGQLDAGMLERGMKRLEAAEDFGRANYRDPIGENDGRTS